MSEMEMAELAELRALVREMAAAPFRVAMVRRRGQWTEDGDLTLRLPADTIRRFWRIGRGGQGGAGMSESPELYLIGRDTCDERREPTTDLAAALARAEAAEARVAEAEAQRDTANEQRIDERERANAAEARVRELESSAVDAALLQTATEVELHEYKREWQRKVDQIAQLEARVRELEERAALPKSTQRNLARFDSMAALIERQAQRIAALIAAGEALREYADHLPDDCPCRHLAVVTADDCECGYLATDAAWERAKAGEGQS